MKNTQQNKVTSDKGPPKKELKTSISIRCLNAQATERPIVGRNVSLTWLALSNNIFMSCQDICGYERQKSVPLTLPSTQEGRALVVPATCPGKHEHLTVWERSSILFLLQQRWAATTSQVPVLSCDDPDKEKLEVTKSQFFTSSFRRGSVDNFRDNNTMLQVAGKATFKHCWAICPPCRRQKLGIKRYMHHDIMVC